MRQHLFRRAAALLAAIAMITVVAAVGTYGAVVHAWSTPQAISDAGLRSYQPDVALSADGSRAIAVWYTTVGSDQVIKASMATISGHVATWGTSVSLSGAGRDADSPRVAISSDGTKATAIWLRSNGTSDIAQSASATLSGTTATWGTTADLSASGQNARVPQIALSADGTRAAAIWYRTNGSTDYVVQSASAIIGGNSATWGAPNDLSAIGKKGVKPQIALSSDGTRATAVWESWSNEGVLSKSATVTGTTSSWTSAPLRVNAVDRTGTDPQIALSDDGSRATVVWTGWDAGKYLVQSATATIAGPSASWGTPVDLMTPGALIKDPVVKSSADGTKATAVWLQSLTAQTVQTSSATITGTAAAWATPVVLSTSVTTMLSPDLALSADGKTALAIWARYDGSKYIVQTATAAIEGHQSTWNVPTEISAPGDDTAYPRVGAASDGSRATAVWSRQDMSDTLIQSASAVLGMTQTITFPQPTDTPLDAGPVQLNATASSGLPVSYSSSTPAVCAISGAQAVLAAVGTCTITANQAGDGAYAPAPAVTDSFAVTPAATPPLAKQTPKKATGIPPNRIRRTGTTVLMRKPFRTNAGQKITVGVKATVRKGAAKKPYYRLLRTRKAVSIRTFGDHLKLRITWKAPATAGYAAYTLTRTYRT